MTATQIASVYARIGVNASPAIATLRDVRSRLLSTTNSLKTMRDQARMTGIAMTAAITVPLTLAGKSAVAMVSDYEKSMALFKTITSASADDMKAAGKMAIALGNDLDLPGVSASDAAQALAGLAKGGLSAKDSMDALRGTLELKATGDMDAARAADILTSALNAYKLPGTEAAAVADLLAAATMKSGATIQDNAEALKNAAPIWAAAHVPIDYLVTSISELAKAGIKGSDSGTLLKTMMESLTAPTDEARGMMTSLGVHVYDAKGKMADFRDIIAEFAKGLGPLSEAQRAHRMEVIFGSSAVAAANVIFGQGVDAFDAMRGAVTEAGAAQKLAAVNAVGLGGAIDALKSAWDTLLLQAMLPFSPILQQIIRGLGTVFGWISQLPTPVLMAATAFVAVFAIVGPLVALLASLNLAGLAAAAVAIVLTTALATFAGGTVFAFAASKDFYDMFMTLKEAAAAHLLPAVQKLGEVVTKVMKGDFQGAFTILQDIYTNNIQPFLTRISGVTEEIKKTVQKWGQEFWKWVEPMIPDLLKALGPVGTAIRNWASSGDGQSVFADAGASLGRGLLKGIQGAILASAKGFMSDPLRNILKMNFPYLSGAIDAAFNGMAAPAGVSGNFGVGGNAYGPGGPYAGVPAMADGGIVSSPTLALIGERGPEMVTPLNGSGAGGNISVSITGPVYGITNLEDSVIAAIESARRRGRIA